MATEGTADGMSRRRLPLWVGVVALLAEVGLRNEPELPSLRSNLVPFQPEGRPSVIAQEPDIPGCRDDEPGHKPVAWTRIVGEQESPTLRMLVAGDSITLGEGVRPEETYAARVGQSISKSEQRPVEVVNAGVNAGGYCHVIRAVHEHLKEETFDLIVIGLFADDLEQRAVTLEDGEVRADPRLVEGFIGNMATRSYLFNWVWFQLLKVAVLQQTGGGHHPAHHVTRPGRQIPARSLANFSKSIEGLMPYNPVFVLIPPVGGPLCPTSPQAGSECDWLYTDMEEMAERIAAIDARLVDLRELWSDGADHTQSIERRWWREHQRLPVHPNPAGHERIAEALLSSRLLP